MNEFTPVLWLDKLGREWFPSSTINEVRPLLVAVLLYTAISVICSIALDVMDKGAERRAVVSWIRIAFAWPVAVFCPLVMLGCRIPESLDILGALLMFSACVLVMALIVAPLLLWAQPFMLVRFLYSRGETTHSEEACELWHRRLQGIVANVKR